MRELFPGGPSAPEITKADTPRVVALSDAACIMAASPRLSRPRGDQEIAVRLFLAFRCFFRVLLGRPMPAGLEVEGGAGGDGAKALPGPKAGAKGAPAKAAAGDAEARTAGAVALLALLQREGRLVDFVKESIDGYDDAQVGAAGREIHRGGRRALEEHVALEHIMDDAEGASVQVTAGFDAAAIRLTGAVTGEPPFTGTLRHPGWRVSRVDLPRTAGGVVAPAEVEVAA